MGWSDYQGGKRLSVDHIDEWVSVKQILDIPIVVLDAYVYSEPKKGRFEAHDEVRFVFHLVGDDSKVYGSSCGWQVPVSMFQKAIDDHQFPGSMPTVFYQVKKQDGEVYYSIREPDLSQDEIPQELPF